VNNLYFLSLNNSEIREKFVLKIKRKEKNNRNKRKKGKNWKLKKKN
jgi:hypothetical protein